MAGLVPAIHDLAAARKTWMPGPRPGMTVVTVRWHGCATLLFASETWNDLQTSTRSFRLEQVGREDLDIGSAIYMSDGVINLALLNFSGLLEETTSKGIRPRQSARIGFACPVDVPLGELRWHGCADFAVCVGDLERSAKFYAEVFDLEQVGREDLDIGSAIYMSDGVINLALLNLRNVRVPVGR